MVTLLDRRARHPAGRLERVGRDHLFYQLIRGIEAVGKNAATGYESLAFKAELNDQEIESQDRILTSDRIGLSWVDIPSTREELQMIRF